MPGVVAGEGSDKATANGTGAGSQDAPKVKSRARPTSHIWSRPKSQIYETNYAKGSRLYSNALGNIGCNSELATTSDRFYRPDPKALDSYVNSILGSYGSNLNQELSLPYRSSSVARSSHARDLNIRRSDLDLRRSVTSWGGATSTPVLTGVDLPTIGEEHREKPLTGFDIAAAERSHLPETQEAKISNEVKSMVRESRKAARRQVHSFHEEHVRMIEERNRRQTELEFKLQEDDLDRDLRTLRASSALPVRPEPLRASSVLARRLETSFEPFRASSVLPLRRPEPLIERASIRGSRAASPVETVLSVDAAEMVIDAHDHEARRKQCTDVAELNRKLATAESKVKSEAHRVKREMTGAINELEKSLEHSSKENVELQRAVKRLHAEIAERESHYKECYRELQTVVNQLSQSKQSTNGLQSEIDKLKKQLDKVNEAKRITDRELNEAIKACDELREANGKLQSARAKVELERDSYKDACTELEKELKNADDRTQRICDEAKRAKERFTEEAERAVKYEGMKKSLENEVRELTARVREVEANAQTTNKRVIAGLQNQLKLAEADLDDEKRRSGDLKKAMARYEKKMIDIQGNYEEERKISNVLQENCSKLNEQIKRFKQRLSDQEAKTGESQARERRLQRELDAALERVKEAEANVSIVKQKHRSWVVTSSNPQPSNVNQFFGASDEEDF